MTLKVTDNQYDRLSAVLSTARFLVYFFNNFLFIQEAWLLLGSADCTRVSEGQLMILVSCKRTCATFY